MQLIHVRCISAEAGLRCGGGMVAYNLICRWRDKPDLGSIGNDRLSWHPTSTVVTADVRFEWERRGRRWGRRVPLGRVKRWDQDVRHCLGRELSVLDHLNP